MAACACIERAREAPVLVHTARTHKAHAGAQQPGGALQSAGESLGANVPVGATHSLATPRDEDLGLPKWGVPAGEAGDVSVALPSPRVEPKRELALTCACRSILSRNATTEKLVQSERALRRR